MPHKFFVAMPRILSTSFIKCIVFFALVLEIMKGSHRKKEKQSAEVCNYDVCSFKHIQNTSTYVCVLGWVPVRVGEFTKKKL